MPGLRPRRGHPPLSLRRCARGHRGIRGGDGVTVLDVRDPTALEAALEAQSEGCWVEVTVAGERLLVVRVPGGWYMPGDLTVASADIVEGRPTRVEVLGDDG